MSNIGNNIIQLRKANNWSQDELAKKIGASRIMIGNYERNTNTPSVDVLIKLAKAFDVSIDFIVGEGANASFDKQMMTRLENIEKLPPEQKKSIFEYIDLVIRDHKAKQAYS